jgi:hypothetical protein
LQVKNGGEMMLGGVFKWSTFAAVHQVQDNAVRFDVSTLPLRNALLLKHLLDAFDRLRQLVSRFCVPRRRERDLFSK